ncbi:MAG TPA: CHRD domain-containing protein, partial [Burkholderiaceae bacterium]|nr:CHRD domain-containing protein [Burkholderiaceae bacterium]
EDRTELSYEIHLDDLLGLKENPLDRSQPDDIIGIHLHLSVEGTNGPHVLNIFGLATNNMPAEDDADLHIDYDNQVLTGKWDISDASRDPNTGELLPQSFPLTSKVITNWLDELDDGRLMVAVHTNESGFPAMAIHGHIHVVVPEPAMGVLMLAATFSSCLMVRRRVVRATDLACEV